MQLKPKIESLSRKRNKYNKFQMPKIKIETIIDAPIDRVFDLARSIDLHTLSTKRQMKKELLEKLLDLLNLVNL